MGFAIPAVATAIEVNAPTRIVSGAILRGGETVGGGPISCVQADRYVIAHRQRALVCDVREQSPTIGIGYVSIFEHALFSTSISASGSLVITVDAEAVATTMTYRLTLTNSVGTVVQVTFGHTGVRGLTTLTWTPATVWAAGTWLTLTLEALTNTSVATHYGLTMVEKSLTALP